MKLVAVVDSDGDEILITGNKSLAMCFVTDGCSIKELHTYDPATQVVVGRDVYEEAVGYITASHRLCRWTLVPKIKQFLSAGKEAT